jgi:hypothetical protein
MHWGQTWRATAETLSNFPNTDQTRVAEVYDDGGPKVTQIFKALKRNPFGWRTEKAAARP